MSNDNTMAGAKMICGKVVRYFCPFDNIVPKEVIPLSFRLTMLKYDNIDSLKIVAGIVKTEEVMIVPSVFGKICFHMTRTSLAPNVLAAKTYSWFLYR